MSDTTPVFKKSRRLGYTNSTIQQFYEFLERFKEAQERIHREHAKKCQKP